MNRKKTKFLFVFIIILITFSGIIYQKSKGDEDVLKYIKNLFPEASSFIKKKEKFIIYDTYDENQRKIGYAVEATSAGYAGPIKVLVGVSNDGHILGVKVLEQVETPWFFQKVLAENFLGRFKGLSLSSPISLKNDIDAVSGATYTAEGIVRSVRKGSHWLGENRFDLEIKEEPGEILGPEEYLLILLYGMIFFSLWKKIHKLRFVTLTVSVVFLGFWKNSPISFANIATLLTGNSPSYFERPFWYLLVVGSILMTLFFGKNLYCYYLCPFGAIQEALYKIGEMNYRPCKKTYNKFKNIRIILAWTAFVVSLFLINPSISSYEPFSALFKLQGNQAQWILMPFVLFIGIFINRFWCHFFCPVGLVMDLTAKIKRSTVALWGKIKIRT